ncbi:PTS system mannnose-specific transporter subunit IIA [Actinobacillus ureae]|uniref:phosphoenolpyruvate--glycerone phosphotransferase n=1 Tax=Actinobacillus ureae ATCC 25976 TaxID=887324 RepID=E8KJ91_9PAST|nr:dihydroxyacetone kinase phosphoryl donor subunit DhaM [Actinobacillus ureae]EFX91057.1 dihydroxyacetone kinase, phosphotransfer subunit [Actinobacillus ureae ATCC 25976]SUT87004.1 PTS system mannnose-specific transporter subunit IIA [Actinobacillus ureae]SUU47698.1 PTS system mannnose-specific transporter subunit IIA [Actinobacillus ureae]
MVNLVIVSHSKQLGEGVAEITRQIAQGSCQIAVAAGIDDPDNPIGTDTLKIMNAIEEVFSEDGVVIFVDLGSAETAIDLLEPEKAEKVVISYAPLVEGAFAAAVAAAGGDDLASVLQEANEAAALKQQQAV